ncbi:MAG: N-carbamoylputrescine amidase [Hydrotalea sp.]|nr:N-carbamoylputrescine amidase [Hydrotalea sp.]
MSKTTIGIIQFAMQDDVEKNRNKAEEMTRVAAKNGATIVLIPELFSAPYFCKEMRAEYLATAQPRAGHPLLARFSSIAKELGVVIPVSFFEKSNNAHYNSVVIIDADGRELGLYRKSHIPDGVGYEEKYYFSPGDTGFRVWQTAHAAIGVGICWDQWFPEAARIMALKGAEVLLYPTAIGSEPPAPDYDSSDHWQNTMLGHAAANIMPVAAANRIGTEQAKNGNVVTFYGRSFISDHQGKKMAEAPRDKEAILTHSFDLTAIGELRRSWGVFRDRRVDLYRDLLTLDGGGR